MNESSQHIKGEFDCLMGNAAKEHQPDDYYKGYNAQYQREQSQPEEDDE